MAESRVYLRPVTKRDRDEFVAAMRGAVSLHKPWIVSPTSRELFNNYLRRVDRDDHVGLLVIDRATDAIAGCININNIIRGTFLSATLGYYVTVSVRRARLHEGGTRPGRRARVHAARPAPARSQHTAPRTGARSGLSGTAGSRRKASPPASCSSTGPGRIMSAGSVSTTARRCIPSRERPNRQSERPRPHRSRRPGSHGPLRV